MSVLGRKLDTFGYCGAMVKWLHRGAQDGYLTEVKYPKTRIWELETAGWLSSTPWARGPANFVQIVFFYFVQMSFNLALAAGQPG